VTGREHLEAARRFRAIYSTYLGAEDLINIGALAPGSNPRIDKAIALIDRVNDFLVQATGRERRWSRRSSALSTSRARGSSARRASAAITRSADEEVFLDAPAAAGCDVSREKMLWGEVVKLTSRIARCRRRIELLREGISRTLAGLDNCRW